MEHVLFGNGMSLGSDIDSVTDYNEVEDEIDPDMPPLTSVDDDDEEELEEETDSEDELPTGHFTCEAQQLP